MFEIVEGVLAEARAQGLREVEVYAERSRSTRIKVFRREVEQLTAAERRGVGVRVFRGGAVGHASTSVLHPDALSEVVRRAAANASIADADEFAALPEPAGPPAEVETFDERFAATTNAQRIEVALELEAAALAADPRVKMAEDAVYADEEGEVFLANSAGVRGSYRSTSCSVFAYVLAEADEQVETGFSFSFGRAPADLRVEACGREAAERACRLLGARSCPSLAVPVVLDPFVAADLFGVIGSALTGDAMQKGRSLFAGREGQRVAAEFLSLEDDGARAGGLSSIPFDDEGVPAQRTALIHDGVLRGPSTTRAPLAGRGFAPPATGFAARTPACPGCAPRTSLLAGPRRRSRPCSARWGAACS